MAEQGSPWLFGTDEPGELAERLGWSATVTDIAEPGNEWKRWYAPATPDGCARRAAWLLRRGEALNPNRRVS